MSDPFTDFMTGQLSERQAAEDTKRLRGISMAFAAMIILCTWIMFI